ncbi:CBL-interacting serine/threonine-protein kinase 8-like isoform X2 [Prosopis cineraria]|uniref:CBL-interacting serine/threonine-protein kinase 8-like isoform X2 n=1 Tax=Prosopis cineraria TaxID=364024 RepID=UPI00240F230D|nr:CBL-interacting serine/threonine-protein kinase 8-like isoform X2 [Prosopis cineraria]
MVVRKVGKYEIGRTIGEGTFAKVKFAQNTESGESVAMKVLDRSTIIEHKMVDQIKREISIMKLVRHPNVVRLHEVLASRTKIYIILEFITGGELFDKIVHHGRISEAESRRYFQQLVDGVDFCHSMGVYHRDLKPENLLLDSQGNMKISDFGLSALPEQGVSILRTTCGTPNYVAPEVLSHKGYDGAMADVWSCGVILYVLLAGYLPFDELDLTTLYSKILGVEWELQFLQVPAVFLCLMFASFKLCLDQKEFWIIPMMLLTFPDPFMQIDRAEFSCPAWFPMGAKSLIHRILDPNPQTRITVEQIRNDEWFKKGYVPVSLLEYEDVNLDDVNAAFDDAEDQTVNQQSENEDMGPLILNAFDLIILSQGLNLASLFDRRQDSVNCQTRFITRKPAKVVLSSMEVVAQSMGFKTHIRNYKMRVEGISADKTSYFSVILEIFEVAPTFLMVDIQKTAGDVGEYLKFYKTFCSNLEDIIWKPPLEASKSKISKTRSKKR